MKIYLYCYTDSVGFPRLEDQSPEMTWPFLLQRQLGSRGQVYLHTRGLGGGRIAELENILERDTGYFRSQGDGTRSFCLFNIGVVDAAPRPFTYHLKSLARIPRIGPAMWGCISKRLHGRRALLQRVYSYRLTPPRAFQKSFLRMTQHATRAGMVPISIDTPLTPEWLEARSPGLRDSIALYNSLKHAVEATHVSTQWVRDEHYLDCGHHLNAVGHELLAAQLHVAIEERLRE
jgi:hypothetical protein